MNILLQFIMLVTISVQIFASIPDTTGYIVGYANTDGTGHPVLWMTNLAGNVQNAIELKNPNGSSAINSAAYDVTSVFNRLYTVGRDGYNNVTYPSLWIGNLVGNMQPAIELKNSDGSAANGGYAYCITSLSNSLYISGCGYKGSQYIGSLWISDLAGNVQNAIELKNPDGSTAINTAYGRSAITFANTLYIVGRDGHNNTNYPCLWISDFAGNVQNAIELKNPDGSNAPGGAAKDVIASSNILYIVGDDSHNSTHYPCLWISDLAGNVQNTIELKNPDGSNAPAGTASGIIIRSNTLYIIGKDSHNGTNYPCLWISDLAGNVQNAIELKNPDGSNAPAGVAADIEISSNTLYIVGEDGHNNTTYPCLWISDLAGNAQNAIELKNADGSNSPGGVGISIYFPIPLSTQVIQAVNSFNNRLYQKKTL